MLIKVNIQKHLCKYVEPKAPSMGQNGSKQGRLANCARRSRFRLSTALSVAQPKGTLGNTLVMKHMLFISSQRRIV
jgi:hypothetical protein